jgi:N-acetylglucosaminyldiphosphoundecaprenol N-acetyl-beta-D-mannosaminyltransferase
MTTTNILTDYSLCESKNLLFKHMKELIKSRGKAELYVVNAHILCEGIRDIEYRSIIGGASFNICDGVNVKRLIRWTSGIEVELYPGPDLFSDIVIDEELGQLKHYFLGGSTEVSRALKARFSGENHRFYSPPFEALAVNFNYSKIMSDIRDFSPDFIWVGLGAPKQEKVIHTLAKYLDSGILVGVGAAFNFHSGIPGYGRAPRFIRKWHLEWFYRLCQEPRRIGKRQFHNLWFLAKAYLIYRK